MTTVGILGAGQLGRMLALAGYPLGMRFRFLDPTPSAPAGKLAQQVVAQYDDAAALHRFADGLSVVTYEFENVPETAAAYLADTVPVYPPPAALKTAQDRLEEKTLFRSLGIPTPAFWTVNTLPELEQALGEIGFPAVLKTRRLGYDGKGQVVLHGAEQVLPAWQALGSIPLILESYVPFERELSVLALRGRDGQTVFYPLVENHHREGILRLSLAPAPDLDPGLQKQAEIYARRVMEALDYVGVLCIELFERAGELLANEMAPRVHNSGHWTIEGAETSQFENHLRAILGLPLGSTRVQGVRAMVNLIGRLPETEQVLSQGAALHLYDKSPRPGRKIGHITLLAEDAAGLAQKLACLQPLVPWEDLKLRETVVEKRTR